MHEVSLRYIVVGDVAVGKTCLLMRFASNSFAASHEVTLGVDFGTRVVQLPDGPAAKIVVWDTAGQEAFRSIVRAYFRGAAAALLVYDVTKQSSFAHATRWLEDVRDCCAEPPEIVLVGNKADALRREVSPQQGEAFAAAENLFFVETSALTGANVEKAFLLPCAKLLQAPRAGVTWEAPLPCSPPAQCCDR